MPLTMRVRPGLAIHFSSSAALSLIRIEKLTPDMAPVPYRIAGIAEPADGDGEIVEVFEAMLDGEADDARPAATEPPSDRIQRTDYRTRQPRRHPLGHGIVAPTCAGVNYTYLLHINNRLNPQGGFIHV